MRSTPRWCGPTAAARARTGYRWCCSPSPPGATRAATEAAMAELRALNLAKSHKGRQVIVDVSLSVASGQIVGLLGPNGAGKTTCFYIIVGLIRADGGRILLDQRDLTGLPMHGRARAGVGYLPQEASIFRKLSVADNLLAVLETRRDLDRRQRRQRLDELLQEDRKSTRLNSSHVAISYAVF